MTSAAVTAAITDFDMLTNPCNGDASGSGGSVILKTTSMHGKRGHETCA
jgi:hypothetical protein